MSYYDPRTGACDLGTTLYEHFHEEAHLTQHYQQTLPWRLFVRWQPVPVLGYWARVLVEVEATWMALAELHGHRLLSRADVREAARGLWTYFRALTPL